MKILHIHPAMTGGGIEAMICSLANEMSKVEDVTVCSIFQPSANDIFWNKLANRVKKQTLGKKKSGFSIKTLIKIFFIISRGNYDVVNIHGMFYYYVMPIFILHKRIKFFYTIHSDAKMENTEWDKKLLYIKKYCFLKKLINPITISKASQESFEKLYHCSSHLIFNGITKPLLTNDDPTKVYRLTGSTKIFIHAGRISTPKNQLVLCKVFKRLIDEGADVVLLILGVKQMEDVFEKIEPYFSNRILYLGERSDVTQFMAHSDGMCLPSIWEGLPVTLLESLSVGCIPICSNVGGIPNVIESGMNGFLSKSSSEEDYYLTMKKFLTLDTDDILKIKKNCMISFSKFDIKDTAKYYLNVYRSM